MPEPRLIHTVWLQGALAYPAKGSSLLPVNELLVDSSAPNTVSIFLAIATLVDKGNNALQCQPHLPTESFKLFLRGMHSAS